MKKNDLNYYYKKMPDQDFFVEVIKRELNGKGPIFYSHWHEHIQFYYITEGNGFMVCNSKRFDVCTKDFVVINSNELHYLESLSDQFTCYIIRVDFSFLNSSRMDSCQTKYLTPLSSNFITFQNLIRADEELLECVENIIAEYDSNQYSFELAVKSDLYRLIVLLLRKHVERYLSKREVETRTKNLTRMRGVFEYIDANLSQKITVHELAAIAFLSDYHFCKLFKQIAGRPAMDYINMLRVDQATKLLKGGNSNITEVALSCGFTDSNYFSRTFKKYRGVSPKSFSKSFLFKH